MELSQIRIARHLFQLGALLFIALGFVHELFSLRDISRPRHLAPVDDQVRQLMTQTGLMLTSRTSMWQAWTADGQPSSDRGQACRGVPRSV